MRAGKFMLCLGLSAGIALAVHPAYAAKPEAEHFQYVSDAVNQINYLKASSSSAKDNAREIVDTTCKMLTRLVSDEQFSSIVKKVGAGRLTEEQKNVLVSIGSINDTVDKESQALQDLGVDRLSSIQVLAAAIPLAKSIDPKKYNPDAVLQDISSLQQKGCSLIGQIQESEEWEKKKQALVHGVLGVAFVLADGAAEYYSWGLTNSIVGFSMPIGANMISDALHDL